MAPNEIQSIVIRRLVAEITRDEPVMDALDNACLAIPDVRPMIFAQATVQKLHEMRKFRHFLRHAYAVSLDGDRLKFLTTRWRQMFPAVKQDLKIFKDALLEIAEAIENP